MWTDVKVSFDFDELRKLLIEAAGFKMQDSLTIDWIMEKAPNGTDIPKLVIVSRYVPDRSCVVITEKGK